MTNKNWWEVPPCAHQLGQRPEKSPARWEIILTAVLIAVTVAYIGWHLVRFDPNSISTGSECPMVAEPEPKCWDSKTWKGGVTP